MKAKTTLRLAVFSFLMMTSSSLSATINNLDTCTVNDNCITAIEIPDVMADEPFVCINGCNLNATPEVFNNACHIGMFPTVWYRVFTDGGSLINIQVNSTDIESPSITMFQFLSDCNNMVQIPLGSNNLPCVVGSNGVAEALGTDIGSNNIYMIAISSADAIGGEFTLCLNTISVASQCVTNRDITIVSRSNGGDLAGPFLPGETVGVCMNVYSYTAANNGCQWFQGLVPVFGNGWDPASFDADGQPLNATINGKPMGLDSNGLYGSATWDWFTDVDYHHDDPLRQIGDFDGNGTLDMCSTLYDPDCPDAGGILGGCCNPCWGTPLGSILPPGWFAYGINGSCNTPGPPIRVDWGDGNSCGGPMGPWRFCFDLVVRPYPNCQQDPTTRELSLGFFTFADGEVGAWTGENSVCVLDQSVKINLPFACDRVTDLGIETVEDRCAGAIFEYSIQAPGIEHWSWSTSPFWVIKNSPKEGENGYVIHDTLLNPTSEPIDVTYFFTGREDGTSDFVIKQVRFRIIPEIQSALPGVLHLCERNKDTLTLSAEPVSGGLAPFEFLWSPGGETTSSIEVFPPYQSSSHTLQITDSIGCSYQHQIHLKFIPCQLDTIMDDDESNEDHTFEDGPKGGGLQINPGTNTTSEVYEVEQLKVFPMPATNLVFIEWSDEIKDASAIRIFDIRGNMMEHVILTNQEKVGNRFKTNLNQYPDGVYLITLQTSQKVLSAKLVKI